MFEKFISRFRPTPSATASDATPTPTRVPSARHRYEPQAVINVERSIIEALTQHITAQGQTIEAVRVPGSVFDALGDGVHRFETASSDFGIIAGLDPFGANVTLSQTEVGPTDGR